MITTRHSLSADDRIPYETPSVSICCLDVESGFAVSGEGDEWSEDEEEYL